MPRRGVSSQASRTSSQGSRSSSQALRASAEEPGGSSQQREEPASQQSRAMSLTDAELTTHSSHVIRYILALQGRARLIRVEDIRKHILPTMSAKNVKAVISRAADQLESVFGLHLVELSKKGEFVLTNQLPVPAATELPPNRDRGGVARDTQLSHVRVPQGGRQKRALIMVILSAIYMNDGMMTEAAMWSFLHTLQLMEDDVHPCFGDVKKFVTVDMVRQRYVKITTPATHVVADGDQLASAREISWGDHASAVLRPLDVLNFVCEVWGDNVEPSMWTSQYRRATQTGEES